MPNSFLNQIGQQVGKLARSIFGGGRVPQGVTTKVWGVGTEAVYAPVEQEGAVKRGFNGNTAVYSIVKKYARKSASIKRFLKNKESEDPYEDSHPLMVLLNRPNKRQSQSVFFKLVFAGYKLFGESFIWFNRGDEEMGVNSIGELYERTPEEYKKKPVLEMFFIPANHIVVISDPSDPFTVIGYHLRNRPEIRFRAEDMLHWMDVNLDWDEFSRPQLRGMSPLGPGGKTLTADNSFIDSMVRMAQNDGAKGAIVSNEVGKKLTAKQETQVRDVIDTKINNKEVKNAIAALEGPWTYLDFGLTSVDMQTLEAREFIYKELCFLFDVPYGFFDSHTPYAEKQLAARDWISNSIQPDCEELDGELERSLFVAFGVSENEAEICSDFDTLPEMQDDKAKQIEWLNKAPLTGNERREALDYETSTEEGMEVITCSETMTPIDQPEPDPNEILTDVENMSNAANAGANRTNGVGKVSKAPA